MKKAKNKELCVSEDEIKRIISVLLEENDKYDNNLILLAINGCCANQIILKNNESFLDCVRERTKQIYLANYKSN